MGPFALLEVLALGGQLSSLTPRLAKVVEICGLGPGNCGTLRPMADSDRILNPHGRRHYRRTYSLLEVRIGIAILGGLVAVGAWVRYRGAHPDPSLLALGVELTGPQEQAVDRGPLPDMLALEDYREGRVRSFGPDNLFEKINGRADFFKSRGFAQLTTVTLQHADPTRSIDVELYDMAGAEQALGTYAAERSPEVTPQQDGGSWFHREPNALFMARGDFYIRATAATGQAPVPAQLTHLRTQLQAALPAGERPWSEVLYVDGLDLPASAAAFVKENAFSFGFARNVHTATLSDGETQLFVTVAKNAGAAATLAARFLDQGFATYGEVTEVDAKRFVTDRYLGRVSVATAQERFVFGVASAPDRETAAAELARLADALTDLPAPAIAQAHGSATPTSAMTTGAPSSPNDPPLPPQPAGDGHE